MLRHKVIIQTARVAFGFSGIYDEDEGKEIAKSMRDATPNKEPLTEAVDPFAEPIPEPIEEPIPEPEETIDLTPVDAQGNTIYKVKAVDESSSKPDAPKQWNRWRFTFDAAGNELTATTFSKTVAMKALTIQECDDVCIIQTEETDKGVKLVDVGYPKENPTS
jgi:hypothetical protein